MLMVHAHQDGLFDVMLAGPVTLIGCGSVGSFTALALTKMGVQDLELWDGDQWKSHNSPMSLMNPRDVGRIKVETTAALIEAQCGIRPHVHTKMYEGGRLHGAVVVCVDDMDVIKLVWEAAQRDRVELVIDTRIAGHLFWGFAVDPESAADRRLYEKWLYSNEEGTHAQCGLHGISYGSMYAASWVARTLAHRWDTGNIIRRTHRFDLATWQPIEGVDDDHA